MRKRVPSSTNGRHFEAGGPQSLLVSVRASPPLWWSLSSQANQVMGGARRTPVMSVQMTVATFPHVSAVRPPEHHGALSLNCISPWRLHDGVEGGGRRELGRVVHLGRRQVKRGGGCKDRLSAPYAPSDVDLTQGDDAGLRARR